MRQRSWMRSRSVPQRSSARAAAAPSRCACWSGMPAWVRGAILHEPGLYAWSTISTPCEPPPGPGRGGEGGRRAVRRGRALLVLHRRERRRLEPVTPALRERLRATASTLFEVELGTYELYLPDEETLASLSAPVSLLVSEDGLPSFPRSRAGSASAWASRSPPRRADTTHITTTRPSSRRPCGHSCARSVSADRNARSRGTTCSSSTIRVRSTPRRSARSTALTACR